VPALLNGYHKVPRDTAPTHSKDTLLKWSQKYGWANRAELYDAEIEAERDAAARAYANEITEEGLALIHERVKTLKALAGRLLDDMKEVDLVWLRDVKQIGSGKQAERVDLIRFNAPLFQQLRGVLDDIAKEMGHRVQKMEHGGPDGGPIPVDLEEWKKRQETNRQQWDDAHPVTDEGDD